MSAASRLISTLLAPAIVFAALTALFNPVHRRSRYQALNDRIRAADITQ